MISIAGTGFMSASLAQWNGTALVTTYVSGTSLTATLPGSDIANGMVGRVTVVNPSPGGGASGTTLLQVNNPVPVVANVNPATVTAGAGDTTLTMTGSGFVPSTTVLWNGASLATIFVSGTQVNAVVGAAQVAAATTAKITASNPAPGGGISAEAAFNVNNPLPVLSSISPAGVTAGAGNTSLRVAGANFVAGSVVQWNGTQLATTFVSSTEVDATIPAGQLTGSEQASVFVSTPGPGGGSSSPAVFTVTSPRPAILSLSPRVVPPGAAAMITLTGTGFESNSVVQWNGSPRPTTYASPTMLSVVLSALDLQNMGLGSLSVSNPYPGAASSPSATLAITTQPLPTIDSASIAPAPGMGYCQQLRVTVTGKNLTPGSTLSVNGSILQGTTGDGSTTVSALLPTGYIAPPSALVLTATNLYPVSVSSDPYTYPASAPPAIALCASPSPTTVYAGSNFSIGVQPSEVNVTGNIALTLGTLPTGVTATALTAQSPATGVYFHLRSAANMATGSYDITVNGTAGTASAADDFRFTLSAGTPPGFYLSAPMFRELAISVGGSGQIQFQSFVNSSSSVDYDIIPSLSGLPPGTTATLSPNPFPAGQAVTITLSAAANAPVTQNATVTLTGTPSTAVAAATAQFYADVTQPPGSLPGSRTDFTSIGGTPYGAVYDAAHDLVFASNPSWNRVDVLSNKTHKIVGSVPVLNPRGLDITQDDARVWVVTATQQVYAINTTDLSATRYFLPQFQGGSWIGNLVEVLSNGTLLLSTSSFVGVWDPQTNTITPFPSSFASGPLFRSGDGTKVMSYSADSMNCEVTQYDVATRMASAVARFSEVCGFYAVNNDGTRFVAEDGAVVALYDASFRRLATVFPGNPAVNGYFSGYFVFSSDGKTLYEVSDGMITSIDTATGSVLGTAPAISTVPVGVSQTPILSAPVAAHNSQILIGIQDYGIAFEDAAFYQNYGQRGGASPDPWVWLSAYSGPLSGGTDISPYGVFDLTPDIWFGDTRGTASISGNNELTLTSPPSTVPGPVNLKYLFPDGAQMFWPWAFTYSAWPQYAILSGGPPEGGVPGRISGYGLPTDSSLGTLSVGGNAATITTKTAQYLPFTGEPFPSTYLDFTVPAGAPGTSDIQVTTSAGSGTLAKAFFYALSVTDYASSDTFTAVLLDAKRKQVYLAAGDHVDVFSTASNRFVTPLIPASRGASKQFVGLALTPDGSKLLVTDLVDGSLAVINPDAPSGSYAIPITPATGVGTSCANGPLYVAATSGTQVFVVTGGSPATSCPSSGITYIVDLQTKAVSRPAAWGACQIGGLTPPFTDGFGVAASADGQLIAIGMSDYNSACLYSTQTSAYAKVPFPYGQIGIGVAGDGNVLASYKAFADSGANLLGQVANPLPIYLDPSRAPYPLLQPKLNAAGSLYYLAYPNYFEVVDVPHATLRMRFSLAETVQNVASPLAIDTGGRMVYLITDKGLTVVDLGAAPLGIGHMSPQTAAAGTDISVRGSGFESGMTATMGGTAITLNVTDENTLSFTMPNLTSGPHDLVLTRSDGEKYTLENAITTP